VKITDLTELALRNLRESMLRNSLTTLGISVGVASLVAMVSLGIGLQQLVSRRLVKSGLFDTVIVTRRDLRGGAREDDRDGPAPTESRALDEAARREIERIPNVIEAYPDIRFNAELRYEDKPHLTMISALPSSAKSNDAFDGMVGSFFSSETAPEVILQKTFAEQLLGKAPTRGIDETKVADLAKPLLGKELTMRYQQRASSAPAQPPARSGPANSPDENLFSAAYSVVLREQKLTIVGVADLDPESMRGPTRAKVFLPLKLGESLHVMQSSNLRELSRAGSDQPVYSSISAHVKNPSQVQAVEDAIKKMGFTTFSLLDASQSLRSVFRVLDLFLLIFGSLALAVASIGIVNTLVMAILERRREIGIMKAIGASDGDVKKLFFAEAGAMGILGGVAGVALGWAIGRIINFGTNIYLRRESIAPDNFWSVPWWLVALAIGFSFLVSLISGLYPAGRAAKLDPVQALRYE
jgi:putative ABC transport system permease protein